MAQIKAKTMLFHVEWLSFHEAHVAGELQSVESKAFWGVLYNTQQTQPQLQHTSNPWHRIGSYEPNTLPIESTRGLYERHGSPLSTDVPGAGAFDR